MSVQRSLLEHEYRDNCSWLAGYRAMGADRLPYHGWKEPYHECAGEIFELEWRNKRLLVLIEAWRIIEDKGITCPITLKAITVPITKGKYTGFLYITNDALDAAAAVAMLVC